jgi:sirohydrochlorin ferrochelatase
MRNQRLRRAGPAPRQADPLPLIAVAHGSKDPRAAAAVHALLTEVARLTPGTEVRAAFLDHSAPSLGQVLGSLAGRPAVVVPLLLTAAYHSKADIPAQLAAALAAYPGQRIVSSAPLGPHPLLVRALERRLAHAGVAVHDPAARAATSVVLAAAGSADPAANAANAALAAQWTATRGYRTVVPAYASAAAPTPQEAVRALRAGGHDRVVVATYLLSPGYFADKVRTTSLAAGALAVSDVLGPVTGSTVTGSTVPGSTQPGRTAPVRPAPEVAELVLFRYREAAQSAAARQAPGPGSRPHRGAGSRVGSQPTAAPLANPLARGCVIPVSKLLRRGKPPGDGCSACGPRPDNLTRLPHAPGSEPR